MRPRRSTRRSLATHHVPRVQSCERDDRSKVLQSAVLQVFHTWDRGASWVCMLPEVTTSEPWAALQRRASSPLSCGGWPRIPSPCMRAAGPSARTPPVGLPFLDHTDHLALTYRWCLRAPVAPVAMTVLLSGLGHAAELRDQHVPGTVLRSALLAFCLQNVLTFSQLKKQPKGTK